MVKIKKEMLQENRKILQDEGLDSSLFCDSWIDDSSQGRDELWILVVGVCSNKCQ